LLNAVQAMPDGGRINIVSRRNNEIVEVGIIDTGTGISKENLGEIFNPLFSTKAQGTGLGLTVCQGIIEAHRGSIEVESEIGKGAKFIVKLPVN
jgi:signal transduction histidine kinase